MRLQISTVAFQVT